MELAIRKSLMVISTTDILLYAKYTIMLCKSSFVVVCT